MIYSFWDIECVRLKLVIISDFLSFYTVLKTWKIIILKKWKKIASDIIILHMCTKNHNHMMYASWKMECNRHKFLSFWTIFCRFTTQLTPKFKIWKKCTERPGDIIFLHMCKWRSCDVWFLRYKAQKTEFLVILGHFLPSDPPNNLNNQNFEKF